MGKEGCRGDQSLSTYQEWTLRDISGRKQICELLVSDSATKVRETKLTLVFGRSIARKQGTHFVIDKNGAA